MSECGAAEGWYATMEDQMHQCSPAMEQYIRHAEHAWNSRDFDGIVLSNTIDCHWRNRVTFLWGREQIRAFIERQIRREIDARILIEPWAEGMQRLALRFAREFRDDGGIWFRAYGSEDLEFDDTGLVKRRLTAANEHPIQEHERVLRWPAGSRPTDHPSLSELGF